MTSGKQMRCGQLLDKGPNHCRISPWAETFPTQVFSHYSLIRKIYLLLMALMNFMVYHERILIDQCTLELYGHSLYRVSGDSVISIFKYENKKCA